jgi:hypothetical protein
MLRMLGYHGSPVSRLPIGAALLAFGLWRHAELAAVVGAVLLVWGAAGVFTASRADRDGQRQGQAR